MPLTKKQKLSKLARVAKIKQTQQVQEGDIGEDERFKQIQYDPKFKKMSKKISKVKLDSRFHQMFKDPKFTSSQKVDKYGRQVDSNIGKKELERYYMLDQEESQQQQEGSNTKYYNEQGEFEWNEESSSSTDSDINELLINEQQLQEEQDLWIEDDEQVPETQDTSNRLALINFDWQNIRAKEIFVTLNSFKPANGFIKKVSIYPSEFGQQRMAEEERYGPISIWKNNGVSNEPKNNQNDDIIEYDQEDQTNLENDETKGNNEWIVQNDDTYTDIDPIKLRKYEKDRLKYYYAVIECDSKQTAEKIYEQCDGLEWQLTSIKIDLRFIPDNQEFKQQPTDVCTELPTDVNANTFLNRAVHHTNVKLTWEEHNMNRFDILNKIDITKDNLDNIDLHQFIASDNSDIETQVNKNKFLTEGLAARDEGDDGEWEEEFVVNDWRSEFDKKNRKNQKNNQDIQITFNRGFNDKGKNKLLDQNIFEEKRQKMNKSKNKKKGANQEEQEEDYFILPEDKDLLIKKEKKKNKEQLELLFEDSSQKKPEIEKVNLEDQRFQALFNDSRFNIDPTSKFYNKKKTADILQEQIKRRKNAK